MLILSKIAVVVVVVVVVVAVVVVVVVALATATLATKPLHATERRRTAPRASQADRVFMVQSSSLSSSSLSAKRMLWVGIAQQ